MIYRWVGAHDSKEKTYKLPTHEWQLVKRAESAPSQNLPTPVPALRLDREPLELSQSSQFCKISLG